MIFLELHNRKLANNKEPVNIVCNDGTICRRVIPSKNSVEDGPRTSAVELRVAALDGSVWYMYTVEIMRRPTYVNVPDTSVNIV